MNYEELDGSPRESWAHGKFSASIRLLVDWADRHNLMHEFLGYRLAYPHAIGASLAVPALSASAQPFPAKQGSVLLRTGQSISSYEKADVTINFGLSQIHGGAGRNIRGGLTSRALISESIEPTTESTILNVDGFVWEQDQKKLVEQEAPIKLDVGLEYIFTRHLVAGPNQAALAIVGHVNKQRIRPVTPSLSGYLFEPETLMLKPGQIRRQIDTQGTEKISETFNFIWRPNGWNKFWRSQLVVLHEGELSTLGGWDVIGKMEEDVFIQYRNHPVSDFLAVFTDLG